MKRDLKLEEIYPYSPEKVWKALTDSEILGKWLMENDFEPHVGHKFNFRTKPTPGFDGIVHCEVLEVDEPRRLSYTWKGGTIDTVVTFILKPISDGTHLTLEHKGFEGLKAIATSFILGSGWKKKILRKNLLEVLQQFET